MNKLYNLLFIAFLLPVLSHASDGYDVSYSRQNTSHLLDFSLGNYSISTITYDGQTYSVISYEGSVRTEQKGFAELPFIHAAVMLDPDQNVELSVNEEQFHDIQLTYPLLPSRGVIYRDQDPDAIPYMIDPKSITNEWYPSKLAVNSEPYILRDIRGTNVYVYPFQYNAAQNTLRVYTRVSVRLNSNTGPAVNPIPYTSSGIVYEMDAIYSSVFINYSINRDALTIGEMGDILVVCTDRDESAIEPYIQWKREKGYQVSKEVVAAGTNIVSLVQDAYNDNNNLLYVQLVGDWADIKCNTLNGSTPPMDPQVGCVVGNDDVPDITVGRFSAESPAHVTTQVNKVITYEKTPQMGATWYAVATGIASNEGPGDDGEYDYEHEDVIYFNKLDSATFEAFNDIYDPGASASDVSTAVNTGTSVINYTGHGSPTSWGTTGFNNSDVAGLSNGDMMPWVVSVACNNGDFHTGTCFAEAWQRKESGGSVMFLGASISQPWNPPMRGQDYFVDILTGGYDYAAYPGQNGITTTEGRTTLGTIIFNGLVLMTTESGGNSDWETAKTWNLFGDPSMQVRTDEPAELDLSNNFIMIGVPFETTISSGGNPVEGAMVTISQDGNYFTGITDASGYVSIANNLVPGEALLVVTAFNTETIYEAITVIPADGPYVIYAGHIVNDIDGNNNGMMDYGESVMFTIMLTNVGSDDAVSVDVTLSSSDQYININDANEYYGTIPSGDTISVTDAFSLDVLGSIPDLHEVLFNLEATGENTWPSTFTEEGHAPQLNYAFYTIDDASGNGNGKLDPDETVDLSITLNNDGSSGASGVTGVLSSVSPYINIQQSSVNYGTVGAGESATAVYQVSAAGDTPPGHSALFDMDISADLGASGEGNFFIIVGQIPVLLIDLDENSNSSVEMMNCLTNLGVGADIVDSWPEDINLYSSLFVCLGIYPENYTLTQSEGQELANYLEMGGNIYMEGGDTWAYDDPTPVHPMFNIKGLSDGGDGLDIIMGKDSTFTEGLVYHYAGDDNWIDQIEPEEVAFTIFQNQDPEFINAVANDAGSYRTIGSSFEFGGLEDGASTKDYLMHKYLEFFGIESLYVGVAENHPDQINSCMIYPNPFSNKAQIRFALERTGEVRIEIYNHSGQLIDRLVNQQMQAGLNELSWNTGNNACGVYFFRIVSDQQVLAKKALLVR